LLDGLRELQRKHALIGDVRGKGLMLAMELVKDRQTKEPAVEERDRFELECYRRGLLVIACGVSTIRLSPPLVIDEEQCDFALETFDQVLESLHH
jgi:4-aminobutyrate aminotransferase